MLSFGVVTVVPLFRVAWLGAQRRTFQALSIQNACWATSMLLALQSLGLQRMALGVYLPSIYFVGSFGVQLCFVRV